MKLLTPTANIGNCKSWVDGCRVSTIVFQFGFISGRTLKIKQCANHQHFFINLASGCWTYGILIPHLQQSPGR